MYCIDYVKNGKDHYNESIPEGHRGILLCIFRSQTALQIYFSGEELKDQQLSRP
jgi:hypothetical protein